MSLLLILASFMALFFACCISIAEMKAEKDWPRETGKYPLIFACTTLLLIVSAA